ncbi:unnamed protein product [Polarella glacialis]|uniref:Uncharacterized protein n=1 Tax=Polarella glacialis TaxID=89957 RepID=A0A813LRL3_POLGL|nr:unnamed protein product [Polarella glacialis]
MRGAELHEARSSPGVGSFSSSAPKVHYQRARPIEELSTFSRATGEAGVKEAGGGLRLCVGASVRVVGLASGAHLNGSVGKLLSKDESNGRWIVELISGPEAGTTKALREQNLEPVAASGLSQPLAQPPAARFQFAAGDRVRLSGLTTRPELNGKTGSIVAKRETRWHVQLDGSGGDKLMKAILAAIILRAVK